ncbi:MAG: hypothetical protein CVU39_24470 [Chloroflexi bacterium HGW-Chloroflexi-10]|nr:MAG: hypothetical protein CVU39_24470 [Chloroflexi bacterium HGW-Chloroflexi-10]
MKVSVRFLTVCLLIALIFTALSISAGVVQADSANGDGIVGPEEEIFNDLFLEGNEVIVEGTIHGMLFAAAETITIRDGAQIDDDAVLFARTIHLEEGAVLSGNVFVGGQNVTVNTAIGRSLFVGGATLDMSDTARVGSNLFFGGFHLQTAPKTDITRNLYAGGYQTILNGSIGQDVRVGGAALELNGKIGGNVEVAVDVEANPDATQYWMPYMSEYNIPEAINPGLRIGEQAEIKGQLTYTSSRQLDEAFKSLPIGGVIFKTPSPDGQAGEPAEINITVPNVFQNRILRAVRLWVSLLLLGALAWWLLPGLLKDASKQVAVKPFHTAGVGLLSLIAVYIGAFVIFGLVLFLSILLGIFTLGSLSRTFFALGSSTLVWILVGFSLLVVYGSKLVVSGWLGGLLLNSLFPGKEFHSILPLFAGITVFVLVNTIPLFGWLVSLAITLVGLGAIWYTYQARKRVVMIPEVG